MPGIKKGDSVNCHLLTGVKVLPELAEGVLPVLKLTPARAETPADATAPEVQVGKLLAYVASGGKSVHVFAPVFVCFCNYHRGEVPTFLGVGTLALATVGVWSVCCCRLSHPSRRIWWGMCCGRCLASWVLPLCFFCTYSITRTSSICQAPFTPVCRWYAIVAKEKM